MFPSPAQRARGNRPCEPARGGNSTARQDGDQFPPSPHKPAHHKRMFRRFLLQRRLPGQVLGADVLKDLACRFQYLRQVGRGDRHIGERQFQAIERPFLRVGFAFQRNDNLALAHSHIQIRGSLRTLADLVGKLAVLFGDAGEKGFQQAGVVLRPVVSNTNDVKTSRRGRNSGQCCKFPLIC